jgi:hypothetical protein
MSKYEREFRGRRVAIDIDDTGQGWTWTFHIEDGPFRSGTDRPQLTETLALRDAESRARLEIDDWR